MAEDKVAKFKKVTRDRVKLSEELLKRIGISPEAYERIALNTLLMHPELAEKCSLDSFEDSIIACIENGLLPDGKQAAIVPFKGTATLIPMIEGRRMLAHQASPGLHIRRLAVYGGDYFEYEEGANPKLVHRPSADNLKRDEDLIAAYAVTKIPKTGEVVWVWLWRAELDRFKARSASAKSGRSSPWDTDYGPMCCKTAEGQLLKLLPKKIGAPPDYPDGYDPAAPEPAAALLPALPAKAVDVTDDPPPPEPEKPKPAARTRRPKPAEKPAQRQREQPPDPGPEPTDDDAGGSPF